MTAGLAPNQPLCGAALLPGEDPKCFTQHYPCQPSPHLRSTPAPHHALPPNRTCWPFDLLASQPHLSQRSTPEVGKAHRLPYLLHRRPGYLAHPLVAGM